MSALDATKPILRIKELIVFWTKPMGPDGAHIRFSWACMQNGYGPDQSDLKVES